MADGYLNFDTKIDESGFNSGITKLGNVAKTGLKVVGTAVAAVTGAMTAGIAVGLKYNATIENYTTSFEVMTGSAEKAADIVERLKVLGAETPFEMTGLADTTQLLMNYGMTADDAISKMMMLGDISQGNAEKMNRIAMAYGQMSSAGKVQLEDVKQMIEAGFNPLQEISESTGESMASLYDRISAGTLAVDEITASMERATSAGGKYYQSMEKQAQTFNGMISTLKDNAMQLLGSVVEPISKAMTEGLLPAAISVVEQLQEAFDEGGASGLLEAGRNIVLNLMQGMAEKLPEMISSGISNVLNFAQKIMDNLPAFLSAGLNIIVSIGKGIIDAIPTLVEKVPQVINSFFDALWGFIPELIAAGLNLIVQLGIGIIKAIPVIIANAGEIVDAIMNILGAVSLVGIGKNIIKSLGKGIKSIASEIRGIIKDIVDDIKERFTTLNWNGIGREIINGIARGITGSLGVIVSAAKRAAKNALQAAKNALGIHSPSTVFRDEVGKYMAEGMGVGFEENVPTEDMSKAIDQSVDKLNSAVSAHMNAPQTTGEKVAVVPNNNDTVEPDSQGDVYEIHVHTHVGAKEIAEETVVYNDEQLGKRNKRKERGNAG